MPPGATGSFLAAPFLREENEMSETAWALFTVVVSLLAIAASVASIAFSIAANKRMDALRRAQQGAVDE